jgi:hypothetical protein
VREQRRAGERKLEDALAALVRALTASAAPWMIIGGVAVIARGVRRMTTDVDAVVRGDAIGAEQLLVLLASERILPRIEGAEAFARENLVLLLRHEVTGVDLDVSFAWSGFEHAALAASTPARYGRVVAPMATPEDLIVFKAIAARPKDLEDAETLLLLYPDVDVARARRRVGELAALAEDDCLAAGLEKVIDRARAPRK